MKRNTKMQLSWLAIFGVVVLVWQMVQAGSSRGPKELSFSDFVEAVDEGQLEAVTIRGHELAGRFKDSQLPAGESDFVTQLPDYPDLVSKLLEADVRINAEAPTDSPLLAIFLTWGPVLLIVGLWIFFMRLFRK